ncbi:response regulator transcription factor [Sphingosinicella sp. BN140058]|uniref:response regulator transcription factor n=1 Tax=Sphingosinicella sp. BN140058 TaxID=1892855 RepID=UPI0010134C31|nr:response regulator [Sphingosinicella sp. BN140058]QAY77274.1 response regulator transcription factor [Sphingosinicella sp. BN140058]
MNDQYPVYIVDDDAQIRTSLGVLLDVNRLQCRGFATGDAFLAALAELPPGRILLDIRMPGSDGIAVLSELHARRYRWPVIVMTGHAEVALAVTAMKLGAIEFLEKPFRETALLEALARAATALRAIEEDEADRGEALTLVRSLTPREVQMLQALLNGSSNKQIADDLGISIRTVEMHRASVMRKLNAKSLADAVLLAATAGMRRAAPGEQG